MLKRILDNLMGALAGVFLISSLLKYLDYRKNPGIYEINSAPWYTSILVNGAFVVIIFLIILIIKYLLIRREKREDRAR